MRRPVSVQEAARLLGVSERRVQRLCQQGRILGAWRLPGARAWIIPLHKGKVAVLPPKKGKR